MAVDRFFDELPSISDRSSFNQFKIQSLSIITQTPNTFSKNPQSLVQKSPSSTTSSISKLDKDSLMESNGDKR
jgi:hypothetical protein